MSLRFLILSLTRSSIALFLIGCSAISQQLQNIDQVSITRLLTQEINTQTPAPDFAAHPPATEGIPVTGYSEGIIEMRIPDMLDPSRPDCVNFFFFTIEARSKPQTIKGSGNVDCHFESLATTGMAHAVMKHSVMVTGTVKPGITGEPRLQVRLNFTGKLSNYFTNVPQGAVNPFTESHPFVWEDSGPMDLSFEYTDGSKVNDTRPNPMAGRGQAPSDNRRIFILHLN